MSSGRKERILISCVSFEVAKIVDPAIYYEATRVHLIHYGKEEVYQEFYDEVVKRLDEGLPKATVIEYGDDPIFDFERMMNLVLRIIRVEQKEYPSADIYVNISAGPSEYCAASLIASMMMKNITPFNVSSEKYQVPLSKIKDVFYEDGRPIGMTKTTREPNAFSTYAIQKPDEKLVLGLGLLDEQMANKRPTSAPVMIPLLAENGLIDYTKTDFGKPDQKSTMNYQRNFIDRWLSNGWVEKVSKREMMITDEGRTILDVFLSCYRE